MKVIICLYVDDLLIFGTNFILGLRDNDCMYYHNLIIWKKKKNFKHFDMWPMSIMYDLKVYLVKNCGDNVLQDK